MKKQDLNNGAVVVTRNNNAYLKVDNTLLNLKSFGGWLNLLDYKDNLTSICGKKFDIIKVFNVVENEFGLCSAAIRIWNDKNKPTWERKDILDDKEREYLSQLIKPFRDKVKYICKHYYRVKKSNDYEKTNYILIYLENKEEIRLPYFKVDTMYRDMETDIEYTLEELGL